MAESDVDVSVLCDQGAAYAHHREPHRVMLDGQPWTMGTCEGAAVLVPGADSAAPVYDIRSSLARGPVLGVTTLGALREWAGPAAPTGCPDCDGGSRGVPCQDCRGTGKHECPNCYRDHDCGCCDGSGTLPADACRRCGGDGVLLPVARWAVPVIGGVYDAALTARWLVAVAGRPDGEEVTVCHDRLRRILHIEGGGWLGVQMGSREAEPPETDTSRPPLRFRRAAP